MVVTPPVGISDAFDPLHASSVRHMLKYRNTANTNMHTHAYHGLKISSVWPNLNSWRLAFWPTKNVSYGALITSASAMYTDRSRRSIVTIPKIVIILAAGSTSGAKKFEWSLRTSVEKSGICPQLKSEALKVRSLCR